MMPTIDKLIVDHINELNRLVKEDIEWIESQTDLNEYTIHVSNLESNLQIHSARMLEFRERIVRQIAQKCGESGKEIYGKELANIRVRRFFAKAAAIFCHKFDSSL